MMMEGAGKGKGIMKEKNNGEELGRGASEKMRRIQMKNLYSELASLLPPPNKEKLSLPNLLDKAESYIKCLKEKVDRMKEEKERRLERLAVPPVVVKETDSYVEVNLLILPGLGLGLGSDMKERKKKKKSFMLHEALIILEQEGVHDVLDLDYSTFNGKTLYTIRCQAFSARIGVATTRVHERLMALIGLPDEGSSFSLFGFRHVKGWDNWP